MRMCSACNGELSFIKEYGKWYCYNCEEYREPQQAGSKRGRSKRKNTCPECSSELSYIDEYEQWYCYNCEEYQEPGKEPEEVAIFLAGKFIIDTKPKGMKKTEVIMDRNRKPLCQVKHRRKWTAIEYGKELRTTDIFLRAVDGTRLGKFHEIPVRKKFPPRRKWKIYDADKEFKGVVMEKVKFIGSDWFLETTTGEIIATMEGKRKKHDYRVLTTDNKKIARCYVDTALGKRMYCVDILKSSFDPFLVMAYVIVLDHVTIQVVSGPGDGG